MKTSTQALLMALLGVVIVKLVQADAHVYYVRNWMQWPLVATAVLLLVLAVVAVLRARAQAPSADVALEEGDEEHDADGHAPGTAWLLLLPVLLVFLVSPAPLGAWVAERRSNAVPEAARDTVFPKLPARQVVPMSVNDFILRTQYDESRALEDRTVSLIGFVSYDEAGAWYVTRLALSCCAADATSFRIKITGAPAPPRDSWVQVSGTWPAPPSGASLESTPPVLRAGSVRAVPEPANPYATL